jgi:AraC-like DNA-binding protein
MTFCSIRLKQIQLAYMISFLLNGTNKELAPFPHVVEFALRKCNTIQFNSLPVIAKSTLRLYYVIQGKFNWVIGKQSQTLYPGDLALVLPGMMFGGNNNYFDIGTVTWIDINVAGSPVQHGVFPGSWCNLSSKEKTIIKRIFKLHYKPVLNLPASGNLLQNIRTELLSSEIGHCMRVNQLLNELLVVLARTLLRQKNNHRDYPVGFLKLEKSLRENLSHQWTVDEMASLVGLGHTAFSEKLKNFTGFSPLNFLINIRISKAVNLLRRKDVSVTDIALDTGFYSSQHFATTFKKLTGYSPRDYRKTMEWRT